VLLVLLGALSALRPARADLYSASRDYENGDYPQAFQELMALAKLGQPEAQLDVAIMYRSGQGVAASDIYAYAWATLAAQNGVAKGKELADKIRPQLAPGSERIAGWFSDPYSPASLNSRLLPQLAVRSDDELSWTKKWAKACQPVEVDTDIYPPEADEKSMQGSVFVEYTLMPDGTARLPRITLGVPPETFDAAVRKSILRDKFQPRPAAAGPLDCVTFYRFVAHQEIYSQYPGLERYVDTTHKRAVAGDPMSQLIYGMLIVGMPQLDLPPTTGLQWFVKAAQAGQPLAQFEVGYSLLEGLACRPDEAKAMVWLDMAADHGDPSAEILLATRLLTGNGGAAEGAKARDWLERAAATGNEDGELFLSALLASAPQPELRDPKRALELLKKVKGDGDDPIVGEIRAAALAAEGHFPDAVKSEQRAIREAGWLRWDLASLQQRLAHYQTSQPWYGNLLQL